MSYREDYISEGFNFLPNEKRVRDLLVWVEASYEKFRRWAMENYGTPNIKSSTRSLIFLYLISFYLDQTEERERCLALFERFKMLPNVEPLTQTEAVSEGMKSIITSEDEARLSNDRMHFPEHQEFSDNPRLYV